MIKGTPIAGAIAGVGAGLAVVVVVAFLGTSADRTDQNADTLQLIKDCTIEPAGKCAELRERQTAAFVRIMVLANSCADHAGHQSPAQIERCITKGMRKHEREPAGTDHAER